MRMNEAIDGLYLIKYSQRVFKFDSFFSLLTLTWLDSTSILLVYISFNFSSSHSSCEYAETKKKLNQWIHP